LERLILSQMGDGQLYPVDEKKYQKLVAQRIRRLDKVVAVSVPEDTEIEADTVELDDRATIEYPQLLDRHDIE
jgi:hypothetical protein